MDISKQCCTLEQAKRLKDEFNISQNSLFHHGLHYNGDGHDNVIRMGAAKEFKKFQYAAYTVAELFVMNDEYFTVNENECHWLATILANRLIQRLENKSLTPEEVNQRLNA